MKYAIRSALVAATALALPAQAAEADADHDIVVTGILANDDTPVNPVRLPQSARISSQTLDEEDVDKRQARDVFDLLNYGTGIFTTTSGKKAPANLNIRGDGNFAFIIDGAYVPSLLASRILQTIPAAAIEEVRIVRTSSALAINPLVGLVAPSGAANNGFIVVRTRKPKETMALIGVEGGSFNTYGANAQLGTTFKIGSADGYVHAIGGTYNTDGPKDFNLDKHYRVLGIKGGLDTGRIALDLSVLKSWAGYGIVRGNAKLRPTTQDDVWRLDPIDSLVATANGTVRWDEHNTTLLTLAYTESKGDFVTSDLLANGTLANTLVRDNDNTFWNAAVRHNLFLGDTKLQAGADFIHWNNPSGQYYYEGIPREEKVTGLFLQGDQGLFGNRLNLDLGFRLDRVEIVKGIDYFLAGRGPNANVRQIRGEKLPYAKFVSVGASWRLADKWLINARYGFSSQGPRTGVVLANPAIPLKGEQRHKWELGFEGQIRSWLQPSVNGFIVKTNNEVQPLAYAVVAGEQVGLYGNTDSKRTGVEAILSGRWGNTGREGGYRASLTHYFSVLDPSGLLARTQPKTVAEITFDQALGGWRVAGAAKYVSGYESNAFTRCAAPNLNCTGAPPPTSPYLPLGDFVNVDFSLSRQFSVRGTPMRLTASVKNLLDDNFETTIGYPSIGRQFGLELTAAF